MNRLTKVGVNKFDTEVGGAGFEPTKAEPTDLQSAPFDRFGIPPQYFLERKF